MTPPMIFAGNWKMHLGPTAARQFVDAFLAQYRPQDDRAVWFFPPAVSLAAVAAAVAGKTGLAAGAQNVHWEPSGAFTGEVSAPLAREAGATAALVGHSERRHVFGETDEATGLKVRAVLKAAMTPVLCVGETIAQRTAGQTLAVVERQLAAALTGLSDAEVRRVVIAYEPVWAIGTGHNAEPSDAANVHRDIRRWMAAHGAGDSHVPILYGGSVKFENVRALLAEPDVNGVLVGGASLDAAGWSRITGVSVEGK